MVTRNLHNPPFVMNKPEYSSDFTVLGKDGRSKPSYVRVGTDLEKEDQQIYTSSVGSKKSNYFSER